MEAVISTQAQRRSSQLGLSRPVSNPIVSIAGREIGSHKPPYLVAEISGNHGGELRSALALILAARDAGADAVKLQTYTPGDLTTPQHPQLWGLYSRIHTPREWHHVLFAYAKSIGITIFSSAFSVDGVRFLAELGVPAIKIASPEALDHELLNAAYDTGLPLICSLGACNHFKMVMSETILGDNRTIYLHCVAEYPAKIEDANLRAIHSIQETGKFVGLSDHTPGYETAIAATALGAVMIEKHFKLDDDCIDAAYSLDPSQFAAMATACRAIWAGMGDGVIRSTCQPRQR